MSTIAPAQPVTMPAPSPGVPGQDPAAPELYRFTVDQYVRMGDAGILTEDDRVELVEGLIYRKPTKKGPDSITCRETFKILDRMVPAQAYFVTREDPVGVPDWESMPEPDISIVRGRSRDYTEQPRAADVPLIVEVAATKSRLAYDQGAKLRAYLSGGIPVYWIVNLVDRQVEVYSTPGPTGYATLEVLAPGHVLSVVLDGVKVGQIDVEDVLP